MGISKSISTAALFLAGFVAVSIPTASHAQATRQIYIKNNCNRPIQMFVHHADGYRNWHPHGWYKYQPYTGSYIMANGIRLKQTEDHSFYFYAETTDGGERSRWQGGGPTVEFDGGYYETVKANTYIDDEGDFHVNLSCD